MARGAAAGLARLAHRYAAGCVIKGRRSTAMSAGSRATSRPLMAYMPYFISGVCGLLAAASGGLRLVNTHRGSDFRRFQERSPYERPGDLPYRPSALLQD